MCLKRRLYSLLGNDVPQVPPVSLAGTDLSGVAEAHVQPMHDPCDSDHNR